MSPLAIAAVLVELALLGWLVVRVRRIVAAVRARPAQATWFASLPDAMAAALPSRALASAIAGEIAAVTLALTGWFLRPPAGFSMHRRTSFLAIVGVIVFLAFVESAGAHLLLSMWSPIAAWIVTALSLYGILWLLGHAHAVRLAPLRVTGSALLIDKGLSWRVVVPRADIVAATPIEERVAGALDLSLLGPNVLLELRAPVEARGPLGMRRERTRLTLSIDDRDAFLASLDVAPDA